jgi:hypothetical protein
MKRAVIRQGKHKVTILAHVLHIVLSEKPQRLAKKKDKIHVSFLSQLFF